MPGRKQTNLSNLKNELLEASSYSHSIDKIELIETHISLVYLTGKYVYKVKKPLKFDFLDFSTIEKRKAACQKELALNRRYAPSMYLETVAICRNGDSFLVGGKGDAVEYAVKMRQFDNSKLLSNIDLSAELIEELVEVIVDFHNKADLTPASWGFEKITEFVHDNFDALDSYSPSIVPEKLLSSVKMRTGKCLSDSQELIKERQSEFVKHLHGDLHLKNICIFENKITMFDGIEFNDEYACSDVWADFAFLLMDLKYRDYRKLAVHARNQYLERTDDFGGLALLALYIAYRACVRAKVNCLSIDKSLPEENLVSSAVKHLEIAEGELKATKPMVFAIGGIPGSGKTTIGKALSQELDLVHVRSDVVRKHLLKIGLLEKASKETYTEEFSKTVYLETLSRAQLALEAGYSVLIDATFCEDSQRKIVEDFADKHGLDFTGLWCDVSVEIAQERISRRTNDASDANIEVLKAFLKKDYGSIDWNKIDATQEVDSSVKSFVEKFKQSIS